MNVEIELSTAVVRSGDVLIIGFEGHRSVAELDDACGAIKGRLAKFGIDVKIIGVETIASMLVARPESAVSDDAAEGADALG